MDEAIKRAQIVMDEARKRAKIEMDEARKRAKIEYIEKAIANNEAIAKRDPTLAKVAQMLIEYDRSLIQELLNS